MKRKYAILFFSKKESESSIEFLLNTETNSLADSIPKLPFVYGCSLNSRKIENEGTEVFLAITKERFSSTFSWAPLKQAESLEFIDQAIICEALGQLWPLFRSSKLDIILNQKNQWIPEASKLEGGVCFYGGSFNPWHRGHEECLRLCPEKNIMIILDTNPHKDLQNQTEFFKEYLHIKEKLTELGEKIGKNLMTYPGFFGAAKGNPTVSWLLDLPLKEKKLLIGDDNFTSIHKWKDYQKLLQALHTLYVVPRLGNQTELKTKKTDFSKTYSNLTIEVLANHQFQDLSSSKLRQSLKNKSD